MQRQFRSDDTSPWLDKYGSGGDSDLVVSADATDSPFDAACTGTSGDTSLAATNANFAAGQVILIHQTQAATGNDNPNWELNKIVSYTAGTITLKYALTRNYTSGAQVIVVKQYNNITVNASKTLTCKAFDGSKGGILVLMANGTLTIDGSVRLVGGNGASQQTGNSGGGTGGGFRGGDAMQGVPGGSGDGWNHARAQNNVYTPSDNSASAGTFGNTGAGGGNGAQGTDGSNAAGSRSGKAAGNAGLTIAVLGGGGSGGSSGTGHGNGAGAAGGGLCLIIARHVVVNNSTGSINAYGGTGGNDQGSSDGMGGGGGAGGSILIKGLDITLNTNRVNADFGPGSGQHHGGDGGVGRIHIDYAYSLSGTSIPTLDSRVDAKLSRQGRSASAVL